MKMAKATPADIEMAMTLVNYLDAISRNHMPDALSKDKESIEWLDSDDCEQYERLLQGLESLLDKGSVSRVVWGMYVICDPSNECIDPDADTIEHHPKRIQMEKDAERYRIVRDGNHDDGVGFMVEGEDLYGEKLDAYCDLYAPMAAQKGGAA